MTSSAPTPSTSCSVVAERAGVAVYAPEPGNGVGDPVKVAKDSIEYARTKQYDIVIVDTAGRLGIDQELMQQAADIRDAVSPDEILFVVDAMIGQDAVNTAEAFRDGVGFDGVVLSKLDGDARGGAALSIAHVTGKQIMFASNGEKLDDFDAFHPDRMASRILGMGDLLTPDRAGRADLQPGRGREDGLQAGVQGPKDFTLDDFLAQMEQVRKMGSISKLLGMLPGMGQIKDQINNLDERDVDRTAAIIKSMTPGRAPGPDDHQRLAPGPYRQGLGRRGQRGQEPGGAVLRGAQDDVADGAGRRHARACRGCRAWAAVPAGRRSSRSRPRASSAAATR